MAQLVKTVAGLAIASVKTIQGLAIASVKTVAGLDNTSGGTPTGNVFSHVAGSPVVLGNSGSSTYPGGAVGDIIVVLAGWENTGTFTGLTASNDGALTMGTAVSANSTGATVGWVVATSTSAGTITATVSGTCDFRDWYVIRATATGTITVSTGASMRGTGTGTSVSIGTYSTATVNGLLLSIVKVDNSCTFSAEAFGGTGATENNLTGSSSSGFQLIHTSAQSSASFTATISTSLNWATQVLSLTAQ